MFEFSEYIKKTYKTCEFSGAGRDRFISFDVFAKSF